MRTVERFVYSVVKITRFFCDYQTWQTHLFEKCMRCAKACGLFFFLLIGSAGKLRSHDAIEVGTYMIRKKSTLGLIRRNITVRLGVYIPCSLSLTALANWFCQKEWEVNQKAFIVILLKADHELGLVVIVRHWGITADWWHLRAICALFIDQSLYFLYHRNIGDFNPTPTPFQTWVLWI